MLIYSYIVLIALCINRVLIQPCLVLRLHQHGIAVKFITNATKISKRRLHAKLHKMGFEIDLDEIFTSLTAARRLLEVESLRPFCLLQDEAKEDFDGLEMTEPNAVVIGLSPDSLNYESLNKAFR